MSTPVSDLKPAQPAGHPHAWRRRIWFIVGLVAAVAAGFAVFVGSSLRDSGRPLPSFPALTAQPDPSLHGTVAYFDSGTGCIRLVAASGQRSKTLWCLAKDDPSTWPTVGKPVGPQLVWRSDGRLEVTMFRMQPGPGKAVALGAGWQRLVTVDTGKVDNVPIARVPSAPSTAAGPSLSPSGQRVSYTFDGSSGRAKVTLTDSFGTRTLLSVQGPGMYGYRFGPVFWAPNWQWIAASDTNRILVITKDRQPQTRVLVTGSGGDTGGGTAGPTFAVTGADLLAEG